MKLNFVLTGREFPYSYYIGLMSAAKVGEAKLWYLERPAYSPLFEKAVGAVESEQVSVPEFPVLRDRDEHFRAVCNFDYLIWRIVARDGGSVMGLDSITLRPFHDLLDGKELLVGIDSEIEPDSFCMHGATAVAGSKIVERIHEDSTRALYGEEIEGRQLAFRDGQLRFGGAGIIPFLNNAYRNMGAVSVAPFGILGGYLHDGSPFYLFEDRELLHRDARTIPFYGTWQKEKLSEVNRENVGDMLLGKLIEMVGI